MKFDYGWLPARLVQKEMIEECSALFSHHYGKWGPNAARPRQLVQLPPHRIREWLASPDARIAYARNGNELIGYAIAVRTKVPDYGIVSWVTQLVVHTDYRHSGIAKTLLFSIWGFSDHYAWGLISANPYAIRALEKATRRRCVPQRIARNRRKLLSVGAQHVPYVTEDTECRINSGTSCIYTKFFVDHSAIPEKLEQVAAHAPWILGELDEGWEWLGFSFQDQEQLSLSPSEIGMMIDASDQVTRQAYARMTLDPKHKWAAYTPKEAAEIIEYCQLSAGSRVLDLGCGAGRHLIQLGKSGLAGIGVDYVDDFVASANKLAAAEGVDRVEFIAGDCRTIDLGTQFDAVLCLFDVIGTYADCSENERIGQNIFRHLKAGGCALLSVMNLELTRAQAKHRFSLSSGADELLQLPPSRTMERTGNIFDPDYYLLDTDTNVVYRKEQFELGESLPAELIVRDRRYTMEEIEGICRRAGLEVAWSRFVQAGCWEVALEGNDPRAKEILVLCKRQG